MVMSDSSLDDELNVLRDAKAHLDAAFEEYTSGHHVNARKLASQVAMAAQYFVEKPGLVEIPPEELERHVDPTVKMVKQSCAGVNENVDQWCSMIFDKVDELKSRTVREMDAVKDKITKVVNIERDLDCAGSHIYGLRKEIKTLAEKLDSEMKLIRFDFQGVRYEQERVQHNANRRIQACESKYC
eukprot:g6242.t1